MGTSTLRVNELIIKINPEKNELGVRQGHRANEQLARDVDTKASETGIQFAKC
jgi:hypothetical protein